NKDVAHRGAEFQHRAAPIHSSFSRYELRSPLSAFAVDPNLGEVAGDGVPIRCLNAGLHGDIYIGHQIDRNVTHAGFELGIDFLVRSNELCGNGTDSGFYMSCWNTPQLDTAASGFRADQP